MTFHITIITLFPEMFPGPLGYSLPGKALKNGLWTLQTVNLRNFSPSGRVDDAPYGGGAGMIIRPDIVDLAIQKTLKPCIYLTPRGQKFSQEKAKQLSQYKNLTFLCGHYEGIDERVFVKNQLPEISIGDFILSGGEMAAFVILDAILRLKKGVLGNPASLEEESFSSKYLEYPQYTKPAKWGNYLVPNILLSGNHQAIKKWRKLEAENLTKQKRPDLLEKT